ncbi:MAG: hypothetical protein RBR65_06990, partial [Aliarcobacter sp.]|nr:hypothetical protein [Aliarcobacter sp.]
MINYIPKEKIISIEIDVSEQMDKSSLKDFVLTSLTLNNKEYTNNDLIYATYIHELKQYQIFLINNQYKLVPFQIFELFYDKKTEGLDLYLTNDFFCLYKNGFFYYYQVIEFSLTIEEFLEFINKKFNTSVNNYKKFEINELEELKNKYYSKNRKTSLKNINIKKDNSFIFYLIYVALLIYLYIYYIEKTPVLENKTINQTLDFEKFKKEHTFNSLENDFNLILQNINKYNLEIISFEYKESKIKFILTSEIKDNLYLFLKEYKKNLISSSIYFDEKRNLYEVI